ncbi:MAG: hypothetical protein JW741_00965 [Sedimentisphaerales bacterium]|nr:hypothetical protein [Sedimentisphaerales bacterium]
MPIEVTFDVMGASDGITFSGFVDAPRGSDCELEGLFDWTCEGCGSSNREVLMLKPQQAFLTRWRCRHCSQVTVVKFRSRAMAEWVAQHTLATTGKAFCELAENDSVLQPCGRDYTRARRRGQRLFAWIAVPALVGIIALGLGDWRRLKSCSAFALGGRREQTTAGPFVRLRGYWFSQAAGRVLCFTHVDPLSGLGKYTVVSRNGGPSGEVHFEVIHEEATGDRVIIRAIDGGRDGTVARAGGGPGPSEATLYIEKQNGSLIWAEVRQGKPAVVVYQRAGKNPLR